MEGPNRSLKIVALIINAVAVVLIPSAGVLISCQMERNKVALEYVRMATGVLSRPISTNDTVRNKAIRQWAVQVVNRYAEDDLKFNSEQTNELINGEGFLSYYGGYDYSVGDYSFDEATNHAGRAELKGGSGLTHE